MLRATLLLGVLVPALVQAQPRPSNVSPLRVEERFIPRGGLSVTLRIGPDRIQVDEVPTFTVLIRNIGTARVLLNPAIASNIRIVDSAARFVPARLRVLADYGIRTIRAGELIPLAPGGTHEFTVQAQYHSPADFGSIGMYSRDSFRDATVGLGLTPGTYFVRFGYYALQDYGATRYDEAMPPALWEGSIETAPVPLTVLPLEGARLTQAIADIDGSTPATRLEGLSALARSPQTIDAWLRRFERSAAERGTVVNVIRAIGSSDGITRLLERVASLPERERQTLVTASGPLLGHEAPGCMGVPWLLQSIRTTNSGTLDAIEGAFRAAATRCPQLIADLRATVQSPLATRPNDWGSEAYQRANIIEMLGRLGDRRDITLLIATVKGELPAVQPSDRDAGTIRGGALRGLARAGGNEAAQVILDQLRRAATDRLWWRDVVDIAARLPLPAATPLLIDLLAGSDTSKVVAVVRALQLRGDRAATPALEERLTSTDRVVRQSVAGALRNAGAVSLPLMRAAVADSDPEVRTTALSHLARRGDSSDLPALIENIGNPKAWEPALAGIDRLGTAATFLPLKARLDNMPPESRSFATMALQRLTFAPLWRDASEWDTWWTSHSSLTRADWAREALARAEDPEGGNFASVALQFLSRSGNLTPRALDAATTSRNVGVRLAAAQIVGESDRRRAVLLIARELENRSFYACGRAVVEFNALTAKTDQLDCTNLTERESAQARWTALAQ